MVEPMSAGASVGTGVIANFAFKILQERVPDKVKSFAPALFFGGGVSLAEIDYIFQEIRDSLLEEFSDDEAVQRFLSPEKSLEGGVLDSLFRKIFLGEKANNQIIVNNLIDCVSEDSGYINRDDYKKIANIIVSKIEYKLLHHLSTAPFALRSSIREVQETLAESNRLRENFSEDLVQYLTSSIEDKEVDAFSKSYVKTLKQMTQDMYISGLEMTTKKADYKQNVSDSFIPVYVKDLLPITAEEDESRNKSHNAADLIKNVRRLLIRGPAGSGKTTLLQWLIWKCEPFSKIEKHDDSLPYFPIYIPLRRLEQHSRKKFNLEDVLLKTMPGELLERHMPLNWLDSLVERKIEVLILIDGLDEVPEDKRPAVWDFVHDISNKYKTLRVLLTSRHVSIVHLADGRYRTDLFATQESYRAYKKMWNKPIDYFEFAITPLSDSDIISLIDRWFEGVDNQLVPAGDIERLKLYPEKLKDDLFKEGHISIKELARTPLICALLCMSYLTQRGKFPESRKDIYKFSTELLISTRDEARNILPPPQFREFDKFKRLDLLSHIALIMQEGAHKEHGQIVEVSQNKVTKWVKKWLETQPELECTEFEYLSYLIDRCSIIREPSFKTIDFLHRSFMEYFAAERIAKTRFPHQIRDKITLDEWGHTLQFCMSTEAGKSFYGAGMLHEMYQFISESGTMDEFQKRKSYLKIASLAHYVQEWQIALDDPLRQVCLSVLPIKTASEVDDLISVPASILAEFLNFEVIESVYSEEQIKYAAQLLSRHKDFMTKKILLSGYHRVVDMDVIEAINHSGKLSVTEHSALGARLKNKSYKKSVYVTPEELQNRKLRALLIRKAWIKFPIVTDKFVGWDYLYQTGDVKFSELTGRDLEIMIESVKERRFDSCKYLQITLGYGFDFEQLHDLFPAVELLLLQKCTGFSFDGLKKLSSIKEIWIEDCTQQLTISKEHFPDTLETIVFDRSISPNCLDNESKERVSFERSESSVRGFPTRI